MPTPDHARLLTRLQQLVEVESPSSEKSAVDRAATLFASWAADLGFRVKRHKQNRFGDCLEISTGPVRSASRTLLLGHLDTVWPLGTLAHMPFQKKGDKLYGPGVLDMKSGDLMALEAMAATRHLNLPITLLLVGDEEIGSPASRPLTERIARQCARVFVLEPAQGLAYKTARKGIGHFTLEVRGVAAHAGVDFTRGHSAVLEMARLIEKVSAFTDLSRGLTVNVGSVHGGTQSNVIADHCIAEVDVRIPRAADGPRIERAFHRLKPTDKACTISVSGGINRPPMERSKGTIALFRQAQAIAKSMGFHLDEASTGGGSDGNFTAALGVPTLDGMGPVGAGAHAPHEHLELHHLAERTELLTLLLASFA